MKAKNHADAPSLTKSTPSAERGGAVSVLLQRIKGVMTAKKSKAPLKNDFQSLSAMLLPHARGRWIAPSVAHYTPAYIESILRAACTGESPAQEQELYSLMEATWPRLLKNTIEVRDAVLGLDLNLISGDGELPGTTDLINRARNGMKGDPCCDGHGFRNTLSALLDARTRGVSICEIEWEYRGGQQVTGAWLPRQTHDLHPRFYGWKSHGRLMLYPEAQPENATDFPRNKFLIALSKAGKGHPSGTALLRCLAWWWCSSNFSREWLLNFAQIFGQPFRWATYDASQEGVRDQLASMLEAMGSAAYGVGPEGTKVEWHESSKSGADNPQSHVMALADEACDLLILGQTLTTSAGDKGSQALGKVHENVRADIIDSAGEWLAEILNEQFIPAVLEVNYGKTEDGAALPYFTPARKNKRDSKVTAETLEIILRSGIPLKKEEVYELIDMSQPTETDETFRAPEAAPASPATGSPSMAMGSPAIRALLAKLPLDAREYIIAKLAE